MTDKIYPNMEMTEDHVKRLIDKPLSLEEAIQVIRSQPSAPAFEGFSYPVLFRVKQQMTVTNTTTSQKETLSPDREYQVGRKQYNDIVRQTVNKVFNVTPKPIHYTINRLLNSGELCL